MKSDKEAKAMMKTKRLAAILAASVLVLAALPGCNTVSGMGQDISSGANQVSGWLGG